MVVVVVVVFVVVVVDVVVIVVGVAFFLIVVVVVVVVVALVIVLPVGILHCKAFALSSKKHENATCVYAGEYVHMKGKSTGFRIKLIEDPLRKRLEITKKPTCV